MNKRFYNKKKECSFCHFPQPEIKEPSSSSYSPFCVTCKKIQPPDEQFSYFQIFKM